MEKQGNKIQLFFDAAIAVKILFRTLRISRSNTRCSAEDVLKAPTKLLSLEDKYVSQVQHANGYFPDISVCELPPSLLSLFELLEDF